MYVCVTKQSKQKGNFTNETTASFRRCSEKKCTLEVLAQVDAQLPANITVNPLQGKRKVFKALHRVHDAKAPQPTRVFCDEVLMIKAS